jgi:predicted nucleic acid-binding protein
VVLLDSDILIEVSRGRETRIVEAWTQLRDSAEILICSPVTVAELWHGARASDHEILDRLFASFMVVPIDQDTGQRAGDYLREYHRSHNLGLGDAFIAAAAAIHGAELWTRNRKHYPMKDVSFYQA